MVNDEKIEEINESGFHLRIIHPGRLSKKDFKQVMYLSSPLVGCTGNGSFGQALSYGKIPYYEQLSQTKETKTNLRQIAGRVYHRDSPLVKFLEPTERRTLIVDNEEKDRLKNSRLITDAIKLGETIKNQYSFNGTLRGMVNAHICRTHYPQFAIAVDEIKKSFVSKEIELERAQESIYDELQKIGLLENPQTHVEISEPPMERKFLGL